MKYTTKMVSIGLLEIFLAVVILPFLIFRFLGKHEKGLPKKWPLVGMFPDIVLNRHRPYERLTEVLQQSDGSSFLFKGPCFWRMEILNTANQRDIHYMMSSNFSNFPKGVEFSKIFDMFGGGIFTADFESWKKQRQLAQGFINHHRFQQLSVKTALDKVQRGLVPVLEHGAKRSQVLDLQDLFQRFAFDVTCVLVTGYDPGCLSTELPQVPFSTALEDAEEAIFYRHLFPESVLKLQRWLGIWKERRMRRARRIMDRIVAGLVSRKKKEILLKDEGEAVDLLTSYMSEPAPEAILGTKPDDKFLRDTVFNLLLAGRDTTSSALTWFFWLLSQNPNVETKIREELKSAILTPTEEAESFRLFKIEEVKNLVYLHGALCESLRLYPPVPFQRKVPLKEDVLPSGHHVHPKMMIMFCLYSMGRLKSLWGEDCVEFKPERWISERGTVKHEPSYKFLAFNAGPRTCLGKEIAFNQMKAVAAAIIHNYNVKVVEGHAVSPAPSIILNMKNGLKVRVSSRWS